MTTLADLNTAATNGAFQGRVDAALVQAAFNIYNEAPNVASHSSRVAFAYRIFAGTHNITAICRLILTNATIAAEVLTGGDTSPVPDGDINFAVASYWNVLAGI